MDAAGLKSLVQLIDTIGLPYLGITSKNSHRKKDSTSLSSILAGIKKRLNMNYLFAMSVEADPKNSTINRLYLAKPRDLNVFPA